MLQMSDEDLLKRIKHNESEFVTLAEIHKLILGEKISCTIEDLRVKVNLLYRDGYLGKELAGDGINMYYILFYPEMKV